MNWEIEKKERLADIENIINKYLPKEESKMDILKNLDSRVQTAGMTEGLTVGIVGCLIFGIGICFGLDVLQGADWLTLLFCGIGVVTMIPAYPIYKRIAKKTKEKLTPEILRLSDEIIKGKNQD